MSFTTACCPRCTCELRCRTYKGLVIGHRFIPGVVVLVVVACCRSSAPVVPGSASAVSSIDDAAVPNRPTPEARAREVLQKQIDAALANDERALRATFAAGSIVLTPAVRESEELSRRDIFDLHGSEATTAATITKLTAGGTSDVVWFYAELTTENQLGDDLEAHGSTSTIRVVELLAASESWRVVASSFTSSRPQRPGFSGARRVRAGDGKQAVVTERSTSVHHGPGRSST